MKAAIAILLAILLPMIIGCTGTVGTSGGGGSETVAYVVPYEKGIKITVESDSSFNVSCAVYQNEFSQADTTHFYTDAELLTNNNPEWILSSLPESICHVFVIDSINETAVFLQYDNSTLSSRSSQSGKLQALGSVKGTVTMDQADGNTEPAIGWYVVLDGSPFFSVTDSTGSYLLTNIPQGNYTITPKSLIYKVFGKNESIAHVEISGDTVSIQNLTVINPNEL